MFSFQKKKAKPKKVEPNQEALERNRRAAEEFTRQAELAAKDQIEAS